jgi:hypothetical protein
MYIAVAVFFLTINGVLGVYNCHFGMTKDKYSTLSISLKLLGLAQIALAVAIVVVAYA